MITGEHSREFGHRACAGGKENPGVPPRPRGQATFKPEAGTPTPFPWKY